ncbi:modulator protein [Clostridiales bacterium COT073_COT-073]|nr:modulator protein [Clostridiales bacterium COT073_COT-073]
MIEKIKAALAQENIATWKIVEEKVSAQELFLIQAEVDMNRSKQVTHYHITVYADFEEDGQKYRGSANTTFSPAMTGEEICERIRTVYYAAGFVKNEWYPLTEQIVEKGERLKSALAAENVLPIVKQIFSAIYQAEGVQNHINATEIFVEKHAYRVMNSLGLDICFEQYKGEIEVVTHAESEEIAVEVDRMYQFADSRPEELQAQITAQMQETIWRLNAKRIESLKDIPVILSNQAVASFFDFYYAQAGAQLVYENISSAKIGESFQGQVQGDKLTMTLVPLLANSSQSASYDMDGTLLKDTRLYQDGKLLCYHGNRQYCSYLNVETTGLIPNIKVEAGSLSYAAMTATPHIELLVFSDFQANEVNGVIGGEIRLARYFDGKNYHEVTGMSMAADIPTIQENLYFSKEMIQYDNYYGPAHIYFPSLTIS